MGDDLEVNYAYKENLLDGKIYKLECGECKRKTNQTVKKSYREVWSLEDDGLAGLNDFTIIQCNGCDTLHFCKISSSNDDFEPIFEKGEPVGIEYIDTFTIYPSILLKVEPKLNYRSIPDKVRSVYGETFTALESGLDRLAATGIRSTLEEVCLCNGASKDDTLQKKIDKLYDQKLINEDMKNLLHKIRIFGNSGVHESELLSKEDLVYAWASLNSLIRYIYGTAEQKEYFMKKRV